MESLGAPADAKFRAQWEQQWNTPEYRAEVLKNIDALEKAGILGKEGANTERSNVQTNPYDVNRRLGNLLSRKDVTIKTEEEKTPIFAHRAGQVKTAKELAPQQLEPKATQGLLDQKKIYADLKQAEELFRPRFATKYIGKTVKVNWLRQNDTDFNAFASALERGIGAYRLKNFGSAQTDAEMVNLQAMLTSDMNISPEGFQKQLNTVFSGIKRDYDREITTRRQQANIIPSELENIETVQLRPTAGERLEGSRGSRSGASADIFD
jgi:hypothetical protein